MDRRRRESEGKAKIEGYMSVSDEEAHHRKTSNKPFLNLTLTVVPLPMWCALPVIVLTNHSTTRDPWYRYMMKHVVIDQLWNLGFVENHYFTRGMGHQSQSKPSFTTISMISLAICYLSQTWRKPWIKHVTT